MSHITPWVLGAIGCIGLVLMAGWSFHRLCIALEDRGYLYYRTRSGSGGGGMPGIFTEVDRLIRPSVQHVVEVRDELRRESNEHDGK